MKYFRRQTQHLRENFLFGFLAVGLFLVLPALTFAAPGDLDLSFGNGGKVITPIGSSSDHAQSVAIQSDGKIVAAGNSDNGADHDFALVRYLAASNSNVRTRFDFDGDGRADISVFSPSNGVWLLRRTSLGFSATQFVFRQTKSHTPITTATVKPMLLFSVR